MDKVYLRLRHPKAFEVRAGERGGFEALRGRRYALLVTFRRDGTPVPTPVWFGLGPDGNAYVESFANAGKLKRLRNDPRVLLAPSSVRGKPLGPVVEGRGRVLPRDDSERAEQAIQANYGLGRKLYMLPSRNDTESSTYLEISPLPS